MIPFETEDGAVEIANEPKTLLAASVWTSSPSRGIRLLGRLCAPSLWLNGYGPLEIEAAWAAAGHGGSGSWTHRSPLEGYLVDHQMVISIE